MRTPCHARRHGPALLLDATSNVMASNSRSRRQGCRGRTGGSRRCRIRCRCCLRRTATRRHSLANGISATSPSSRRALTGSTSSSARRAWRSTTTRMSRPARAKGRSSPTRSRIPAGTVSAQVGITMDPGERVDWFSRRPDIVRRLQQLLIDWERDVDLEAKAFAARGR